MHFIANWNECIPIIYVSHYNIIVLLFQHVEAGSPAFESGLRANDIITHVNEEATQGSLHTDVIQMILSSGHVLQVRTIPMENTSIRTCVRKRGVNPGKMARSKKNKKQVREKTGERKKSRSLFRRLSNRKAEQHALPSSPLTPSRGFSALSKSLSSSEGTPTSYKSPKSSSPLAAVTTFTKPAKSPPLGAFGKSKSSQSPPLAQSWSPESSTANSSNSSSPSSSVPNSPASSTSQYCRPSSLHGLKHKRAQSLKSPHRRKSVHNIPLSPLARTPSPSPMVSSPTRSPSPLAVHHGHQTTTGTSNLAQHTMPRQLNTSNPVQGTPIPKKSFTRPKSCEPGSPLLRRALSPDRLLHPNSAEKPKAHRKSSWIDKKTIFETM